MSDINYKIIDSDFEIIEFTDGKERHSNDPFSTWGLEYILKRNLVEYYYFSVNSVNEEKKCIPGDAYINDVKAETIKELSAGNYLIKKDLIQEPFIIKIESVNGRLIKFKNLKYSDSVGFPGEKIAITITDSEIFSYSYGDNKPKFIAHRLDNDEVVSLKDFEYYANKICPWLSFTVPNYDIYFEVVKAIDENKGTLIIDRTAIAQYEYARIPNYNIYFDGLITEAIYSDDYDVGVQDHYFYERKFIFNKGTPLTVEIYLLEEMKVICILNDEEYEPYKHEERLIAGNDRVKTPLHSYTFEPFFKQSGTLSFKIIK